VPSSSLGGGSLKHFDSQNVRANILRPKKNILAKMNLTKNNPRVGIGVMIFRDGKVLIGKRKSKLGEGEWSFPGGHLESGESFTECAIRETREEVGIEIQNVCFQMLGNIPDAFSTHYVQISFVADWKSGEPEVLEPTKCECWEWRTLDTLPSPLFYPTKLTLDAWENKTTFLDNKK
jgi:8-oxo-dGTP diphosphatase